MRNAQLVATEPECHVVSVWRHSCTTRVPPKEHSRTVHSEVRHKDVLLKIFVLHWRGLSPKILPLPTQNSDGPEFLSQLPNRHALEQSDLFVDVDLH
jgi:hypothetical protein